MRVGVDLVRIREVRESLEQFGDRYLRRVFTDGEIAYCGGDASKLAARFAAKEAAIKVLRVFVTWRDIEVRRSEGGWCELHLHGQAAAAARAAGLRSFSVSLSHEGDYAAAVVAGDNHGQ
jgi:holo-[acyl-carrier protein] synthase